MSGSGDFLAQMADGSRRRLERARQLRSEADLRRFVAALPDPLPLRFSDAGFDLIAELKLRSPAIGKLKAVAGVDLAARVHDYALGGAVAVSVLTEPTRFDGSMTHLERAARQLLLDRVPAMRKDFLIDPYQVLEARAAGAGGVLVILRMLPRTEVEALIDTALELGMFVLLECFDSTDIDLLRELLAPRTAAHDRLLCGVNCRDLTTLQIVPERLFELVEHLPAHCHRVAESGVASAEQAARVAAAGYDLALVGSALMTGDSPQPLAASMIQAGRSAHGQAHRLGRTTGAAS